MGDFLLWETELFGFNATIVGWAERACKALEFKISAMMNMAG